MQLGSKNKLTKENEMQTLKLVLQGTAIIWLPLLITIVAGLVFN